MNLDEFHARFELGRNGRPKPKPGARLPTAGSCAPTASSGATPEKRPSCPADAGSTAVAEGSVAGPPKDGNARTISLDLPPMPPRRGGHNREVLLQRRIVIALRREGHAALAVNGEVGLGGRTGMLLQMGRAAMGYEAGTPDIIVALPEGRTLWLEVKTPSDEQGVLTRIRAPRRGGRLSKEQKRVHALLRGLGHRVETVRSEDEAIEAASARRRRKRKMPE